MEKNTINTPTQFDWVDFYREFAEKLLQYKNNRPALIAKVKQIYEITGINQPVLEMKDEEQAIDPVDIDPFTIFGLFNKGITVLNRIKMIKTIAGLFAVNAPIPTSFDSIPVLFNQNVTYYNFIYIREENDIDDLWNLFEAALFYSSNPAAENYARLSRCFDLVIKKEGIANGKITMGLYWIAPHVFLNLDKRNIWYIYESGKMPAELVQSLPEIETRITSAMYFDITEKVRAFLQSPESPFKNFMELSFEAWRHSEKVNQERREKEKSLKPPKDQDEGPTGPVPDVPGPEPHYPPYIPTDFLSEVYMSESNYHTLITLLKNKKNVIIQGAPGVGKTFAAKRLAYSLMGIKDDSRVMMVQFHQSYSYEDFIMGYRPSLSGGFELKHGPFYNFCKKAVADPYNEYFFIIDEINRGNLGKIFGELFMLIENDKRGSSLRLLYSDEKFSVPANLHIIGMMNTADRSLAMLDYALRRRFAFFELSPAFETEGFQKYRQSRNNPKFDNLIAAIEKLNTAIEEDDTLGRGFRIGHSYFCTENDIDDMWLNSVITYEIIPLLNEYWFDEPSKVREWENTLREAIR